MSQTATLCGMCKEHELVRAETKSDDVVFMLCPNCDSPGGEMPKRTPEEEQDQGQPDG